jgi:hypothetical protein
MEQSNGVHLVAILAIHEPFAGFHALSALSRAQGTPFSYRCVESTGSREAANVAVKAVTLVACQVRRAELNVTFLYQSVRCGMTCPLVTRTCSSLALCLPTNLPLLTSPSTLPHNTDLPSPNPQPLPFDKLSTLCLITYYYSGFSDLA